MAAKRGPTAGRMSGRALGQAAYAIVATILALVLLLIWPDEVGAALSLVEISAALVLAAALFPPGVDRHDLGDMLFLVSLPFMLGFGVRTLLSLAAFIPITSAGDIAQDPGMFFFDQDSLRALTLAVISWGVLFVGYRLRIGSAVSTRLPDLALAGVDAGSIRVATLLLAAVGWSARIAVMVEGGTVDASSGVESVNALSTLLIWLSFLTTAASTLALFGVLFRRVDLVGGLLAFALVCGELVAGFITGSRTLMFTPLVGAAAMAYLTGRYHFRLRYLVVVPALLLVIGVTDTYRNPGLIGISAAAAGDTVARVQSTIEESIDQGPAQLAYRGAFNVAIRYHGLYSVAQILRIGQPSDLSYGTAYAMTVPAALIPRFLWPNKPLPTPGVDFGRQYFGLPDSVGVSIAPTWVGDLLLNVPWFLVPIAMGLLGVLIRTLREYGLRGRNGATSRCSCIPSCSRS